MWSKTGYPMSVPKYRKFENIYNWNETFYDILNISFRKTKRIVMLSCLFTATEKYCRAAHLSDMRCTPSCHHHLEKLCSFILWSQSATLHDGWRHTVIAKWTITKMETTLLVPSSLTFFDFLWCLNFVPWAGNSNIVKNWRMSTLERQIMPFPF